MIKYDLQVCDYDNDRIICQTFDTKKEAVQMAKKLLPCINPNKCYIEVVKWIATNTEERRVISEQTVWESTHNP